MFMKEFNPYEEEQNSHEQYIDGNGTDEIKIPSTPDSVKEAWKIADMFHEQEKNGEFEPANEGIEGKPYINTESEEKEEIFLNERNEEKEEVSLDLEEDEKKEELSSNVEPERKTEELSLAAETNGKVEEVSSNTKSEEKIEERASDIETVSKAEAPALGEESGKLEESALNTKPEKKHKKSEKKGKQQRRQDSFSYQAKEKTELVISVIWNIIRCLLTGMYRTLKFFLNLATVLIIVAIIGGGILFARYHTLYTSIRQTEYDRIANLSEQTFTNLNNTRIYDDKGKLLSEISSEDYEYVEINHISRYIQEGYIAVEDKNFKEHIGFDPVAIFRAGVALVKNSGAITQGGSTITQQVVKNTLLTSEQTYVRKCAEILLAMDLEKKFTKAQIMEFYVNSNFYGNQCYGVEAACQYYFGKSAADVNISEAAMIVGISNSPSKYNPVSNYDLAIKKRNSVLKKMYDNGVISKKEKEEAQEDPLLVVENRTEAVNENYQVSYAIYSAVITLMEQDGFEFKYTFKDKEEYNTYREKYSEVYSEISDQVRSGGYDIYTSLNRKQQSKLQKSVDSVLAGFSEKQEDGRYAVQGAAVCVDNETGYVTAIVGGRGKKDQYNRAYLAKRQPGSTIKPLIDYAPAFETGEYYPSKIMNDHPIENGPRNSGGSYRGNISMREAIARSINTIAYQTLQGIGVDTGLSYLANMRFHSLSYVDNDNLSVSIGGFTNGVRVVEMAKGYSTLACGGTYIERSCIRKIEQQGEGVVYTDTKTSHQVFLEDTAWLMTNCLRGTMELPYGTGHGCALDGQISAGKTGTTNNSKDGWFCGYTTRYTTAVWVGRDDNKSISGMYGATYAGKVWQSYMNEIHKGLEKKDFIKPDTVQKKNIDSFGLPCDRKTGKTDYFSAYGENRRSLLEQEKEEKRAEKEAKKAVIAFEKFYIEKVEDCYQVDRKYKDAMNMLADIADNDVRVSLSTRVADKYAELKEELKNWKDIMAAYEIEQARKAQEAKEKAAKAAEKAEKERQKQLAITRFKNALKVVQDTTDEVTDYTYKMLDLASKYLSDCAKYSEYDTLLQQYNTEKARIKKLAEQNQRDQENEEEQERQEEQEAAERMARDKKRVEQEKRE